MRIKLSFKNALILLCIVFTILTVISSGWNLLQGRTTDTHLHILLRFVITFLAISSLLIFNLFPDWPLPAIYGLHYAVTMAVIFLIVLVSGFYVELHPDAYRDIFFNFTVIYILIATVLHIIAKFKRN